MRRVDECKIVFILCQALFKIRIFIDALHFDRMFQFVRQQIKQWLVTLMRSAVILISYPFVDRQNKFLCCFCLFVVFCFCCFFVFFLFFFLFFFVFLFFFLCLF